MFYKNYKKVGLLEIDFNQGFSSMLGGRIREYYFEKLAPQRPRPTFIQMCEDV
jgi:hypothetical protein